jgi:hypothetical protein
MLLGYQKKKEYLTQASYKNVVKQNMKLETQEGLKLGLKNSDGMS